MKVTPLPGYRAMVFALGPEVVFAMLAENDPERDRLYAVTSRARLAVALARHVPEVVHFGERWTIPAEVCAQCSDPVLGIWVPASFCSLARLVMERERCVQP